MLFGIDRLTEESALHSALRGRRAALLAHPASVTRDLVHSLDALDVGVLVGTHRGIRPAARFARRKQDNMIDRLYFLDPVHDIPVFSLNGRIRRVRLAAMMSTFDVLLVDLQDVGCRIYTFITTLRYVLEEAARHGKAVWVLDRPNPAGRPVEGLRLREGWQSFVGAGPLPMRHGLTLGELGHWFIHTLKLDVDYDVITMRAGNPRWRPVSAGRSTNARGSIPARTPPIFRWRAVMRAR